MSGSNGEYEINQIPPGIYDVKFKHLNQIKYIRGVSIHEKKVKFVDIRISILVEEKPKNRKSRWFLKNKK